MTSVRRAAPTFWLPAAERADEDDLLGVLADVDEAAGAGELRAELADIEVAVPVDLGEPEEGRVQAAAVVEVELVGLVDDRLGIGGRAKIDAAGRYAADDAGLGGQRDEVDDLFFVGDAAMPSGMPMPRLTTLLALSSNAARRAMILRSLIAIGGSDRRARGFRRE